MQRFVHPLALCAVVLLQLGLIANGIANAYFCLDGCTSGASRTRFALLLMGPGIVVAIAAWDLALSALAVRGAWRSSLVLFGVSVAGWAVLLRIAPTLGVPGLGEDRVSSPITALETGALVCWVLMCGLFVLFEASTPAKMRARTVG
jgi:hypothetical protein